ncbi:MAG: SulP family inorganic anion transporter [Dehalococcoidia bacterium]
MPAASDKRTSPQGISRWLPGLASVRHYDRSWLSADILAGVTVCAILIPQGMAYGELAGLPPVTGLYAAIGAMVLYALVTSTRAVMVGPEAGVAIIVASVIAPLAAGSDPARAAALAGVLGLLVAGILVVGGLVRVGFIVDFVSKPVLSGYIIGAAGIIIASQLGKLFGFSLEQEDFFPKIWELLSNLDQTHRLTFLIGVLLIITLLLLKRFVPKAPSALIVLVLSTIASAAFNLDDRGVATLGAIPAGLPRPGLPDVTAGDIHTLLPAALGIALIAFTEGVLTARAFAEKRKEPLDANQESIAFGFANAGAALFQGFPIGVSQSRTVVDDSAGGKSQLAAIVATALVVIFLLFFTALLEPLPSVALGAIVVVAALGLIEIQPLRELARVDRTELTLAIVALFGVLILGILQGIMVAVLLSLLVLLAKITRPHDAILVHDDTIDGFREIEEAEIVQAASGLIVYRFDAPLFFANASTFAERVGELATTDVVPVRRIIIDVEPIVTIDTTAADTLLKLHTSLSERGVSLGVARANESVMDMLGRMGVIAAIGPENFYPNVRAGLQAWVSGRGQLAHATTEGT